MNIRKANIDNCKGCTYNKPDNKDHTCIAPWKHRVEQFFEEQLVRINDIQDDLQSISQLLKVNYEEGEVHPKK